MLNAMPIFDTLRYADELQASGVPEQQARAHTRVMADAFEKHVDRLATKDDLRQLGTELRGEMNQLRTEMLGAMGKQGAELGGAMGRLDEQIKHMRWMFGLIIGGIAAIVLRVYFPA
jgi:hypothetical protein